MRKQTRWLVAVVDAATKPTIVLCCLPTVARMTEPMQVAGVITATGIAGRTMV